jgi:hypothetical protein
MSTRVKSTARWRSAHRRRTRAHRPPARAVRMWTARRNGALQQRVVEGLGSRGRRLGRMSARGRHQYAERRDGSRSVVDRSQDLPGRTDREGQAWRCGLAAVRCPRQSTRTVLMRRRRRLSLARAARHPGHVHTGHRSGLRVRHVGHDAREPAPDPHRVDKDQVCEQRDQRPGSTHVIEPTYCGRTYKVPGSPTAHQTREPPMAVGSVKSGRWHRWA